MSVIRDDIYKMSPEKALKVRQEFESQLQFEKEKFMKLKKRRVRLIKTLDKEIADAEESMRNSLSVIEMIDAAHFNTVRNDDYSELLNMDSFDEG